MDIEVVLEEDVAEETMDIIEDARITMGEVSIFFFFFLLQMCLYFSFLVLIHSCTQYFSNKEKSQLSQ